MSYVDGHFVTALPELDKVNAKLLDDPLPRDRSPSWSPDRELWQEPPESKIFEIAMELAMDNKGYLEQAITRYEKVIVQLFGLATENILDQATEILDQYEKEFHRQINQLLAEYQDLKEWAASDSPDNPPVITIKHSPEEKQEIAEKIAAEEKRRREANVGEYGDLGGYELLLPPAEGDHTKENKEYWSVKLKWYDEKRAHMEKNKGIWRSTFQDSTRMKQARLLVGELDLQTAQEEAMQVRDDFFDVLKTIEDLIPAVSPGVKNFSKEERTTAIVGQFPEIRRERLLRFIDQDLADVNWYNDLLEDPPVISWKRTTEDEDILSQRMEKLFKLYVRSGTPGSLDRKGVLRYLMASHLSLLENGEYSKGQLEYWLVTAHWYYTHFSCLEEWHGLLARATGENRTRGYSQAPFPLQKLADIAAEVQDKSLSKENHLPGESISKTVAKFFEGSPSEPFKRPSTHLEFSQTGRKGQRAKAKRYENASMPSESIQPANKGRPKRGAEALNDGIHPQKVRRRATRSSKSDKRQNISEVSTPKRPPKRSVQTRTDDVPTKSLRNLRARQSTILCDGETPAKVPASKKSLKRGAQDLDDAMETRNIRPRREKEVSKPAKVSNLPASQSESGPRRSMRVRRPPKKFLPG